MSADDRGVPMGRSAAVAGAEALMARLAAIGEELADLALDRLQRVVGADELEGAEAARWRSEERRLTKARRAVERALVALGGVQEPLDDTEDGSPSRLG